MRFAYFGYDKFDAYMNMAIDEALLSLPKKNYIRFYDFERPSLILAYVQHPDDVIWENVNGFDVTRRLSQGGVIMCSESTLCYSITVPKKYFDFSKTHATFGSRVAHVLKKYAGENDVDVGEHFSVRIGGKTVIGNGQRSRGDMILYHGTIALDPWDLDALSKTIRMDKEEAEFVRSLPCIRNYSKSTASFGRQSAFAKYELVKALLSGMTENSYSPISDSERNRILVAAGDLARKYRDPKWVNLGPYSDRGEAHREKLMKGWGFCFSDLKSPEPIRRKIL